MICRLPKPQKLDKWVMAGEKRQTCWPRSLIPLSITNDKTSNI